MKNEPIRTLFSRENATVFPKLGAFLAGPTPFEGEMINSWRRVIVDKLLQDKRLDPSMIIVLPEPKSGDWKTIDIENPKTQKENIENKQIVWEWQYLNLCDITTFWLPTYWNKENSGIFSPNIGATSRLEFGYYFQEYLKDTNKKTFIVGSPEDAEGTKWMRRITDLHGIKWHTLKKEDKHKKVADSFIEAIAEALLKGKWNF